MKKTITFGTVLLMALLLCVCPWRSASAVGVQEAAMRNRYQFALQQISFEHIYPDGTDIGFDSSFGAIEDNRFAIFDVDGDGMDELIVTIITAPMAGQMETIYQYDPSTDSLQIQFQAFPMLTYYTNGMVLAGWSHNHTLSMQWPYDLYVYDAATDAYISHISVFAWDRELAPRDQDGIPYPEHTDKDHTGTVYCIAQSEERKWICQADYENWRSMLLTQAEEMNIPYQPMAERNIAQISE